jgi:L-iditol 2-dehydrogenase
LKSVVLVDNAKLEVAERGESALAAENCRIAVHAAGVCSSDVPRAFDRGAYFFPLVMGHELAGTVLEAGTGADGAAGFAPGDRVTVFPLLPCRNCEACAREAYAQCHDYSYYGSRRHGGFAERLDVRTWNLLQVPDKVALEDAALCEPTAVVVHALRRLGVLNGETTRRELVVLGGGFLGLIAAQIVALAAPDITVTVLDRNEFKLEIAKLTGADTVLLREPPDWQAYGVANEGRFPLVLEAAGAPATYENALRLAARKGAVVWMGNISGDLNLPADLVSRVLRKELAILGAWNSEYHGEAPSDWTAALDFMAAGLHPSGLVSLTVDLDGLPTTLRRLHDHKQRITEEELIKVMVKP